MRLTLCVGLLFLCAAVIPFCASGASFGVDQILVTGSENVSPGDYIQVSARISFDSSGEVTFPESDTLQLSTELMDAEWRYTLIVDNNPVQTFYREAGVVFINGYYLEYSQGRSEYLSVEVSGIVPVEGPEGIIDALTVTQYDEYGNVRGNGVSTIPVTVDTNAALLTPDKTHLPEPPSPVPTESPLNEFGILMGIVSALVIVERKKGD